MSLSLLPTLALVLGAQGATSSAPPDAPQAPATTQEPGPTQEPGATQEPSTAEEAAWRERLERDARVDFAPLTGREALEALEGVDLQQDERAAALFALGSSATVGERQRLENWAQHGAPRERRAAILALGELGPGSTALLLEIARTEQGDLAQCALLALLRSGQRDAVAAVEQIAARPDDSLAEAARALIAFQRDRASAPPSVAGRIFLDLRYESARRFGLIDGKTWRVLLYERLSTDDAFLDQVVFQSARRLRMPGVRDYFLDAVRSDGGEQALRAAVDAIPNELAQMAAAGLWQPQGDQWVIVLEEIEEQRVESLCEPLLLQALSTEGLEGWAAFLLLRGGNTRGKPVLERSLRDATPQTRRRVAEGLGATGNRNWLSWLQTFARDDDEEVRAAALVAEARLGSEAARTTLEILLFGEGLAHGDMSRGVLVEALARTDGDRRSLELLEQALPLLVGRQRMTAAVALAKGGRTSGAEIVREQLRASVPRGAEGARLVRALGSAPTAADIELLRSIFPREDDLELNVALAEVLLEAKTPAVIALLRGALWHPPLPRSMLAAALVVDSSGIATLRRELESAPRSASLEDLRRVGFALGFWGGTRQVEELVSRRWDVGDAGLQGAVLGALAARTL